MANEAQIRASLQVRKGGLFYQSQPTAFTATVTGTKGPTPGAVQVSTAGTDIDFSQLTTPGLVRLQNLDATNVVEWGVWEPATSTFYPVGELLPGETFVFRFSRNLQEEYLGTGTATSAPTNRFRMKASGAACTVLVEAFEV